MFVVDCSVWLFVGRSSVSGGDGQSEGRNATVHGAVPCVETTVRRLAGTKPEYDAASLLAAVFIP